MAENPSIELEDGVYEIVDDKEIPNLEQIFMQYAEDEDDEGDDESNDDYVDINDSDDRFDEEGNLLSFFAFREFLIKFHCFFVWRLQ